MTCVVACAVCLKLDLLRDGAAAIHSNCTMYSLCRKVRNVKCIRNRYRVRAIEKKNISQLWTNYESPESSNSNVQCGFYNTQIYAEYRSALRPCLGAALLRVL